MLSLKVGPMDKGGKIILTVTSLASVSKEVPRDSVRAKWNSLKKRACLPDYSSPITSSTHGNVCSELKHSIF